MIVTRTGMAVIVPLSRSLSRAPGRAAWRTAMPPERSRGFAPQQDLCGRGAIPPHRHIAGYVYAFSRPRNPVSGSGSG